MVIYSPPPCFKGSAFKLCVLNRLDFKKKKKKKKKEEEEEEEAEEENINKDITPYAKVQFSAHACQKRIMVKWS